MKFLSATVIDKTLDSIKDSLRSARSVYQDKRAESEKLNREITEILQAPRTREDLEQSLCSAVNRYVDHCEKPLINWCQRVSRILQNDDIAMTDAENGLVNSFIGYRDQSGIEGLLREVLLDGAKRLAATVDWPDNAMDQATREQRLAQLQPRRDALSKELDEIYERANEDGITL